MLAGLASQPVPTIAAAEPAKVEKEPQRSSDMSKPAAAAAEAKLSGVGEEGMQMLAEADQPKGEAGDGNSLIRVSIDEARGLPEATSGARFERVCRTVELIVVKHSADLTLSWPRLRSMSAHRSSRPSAARLPAHCSFG